MLFSAAPQWVLEPTDLKIRKGGSAIIHCKAEGSPKVKISWRKTSGKLFLHLRYVY